MENAHKGHRARLRERFLNSPESLKDHELLELLLFFALPQRSTNELAHVLLQKCDGINGVFNADYEFLKDISGMGETSAVLVKLIPLFMKRYEESVLTCENKNNFKNIKEFFIKKYIGEMNESVLCACFDDKLNVLGCQIVKNGDVSAVPVDIKKIVKFSYSHNSNLVVIAHNHPSGELTPSDEDKAITRLLAQTLRPVEVILLDHIIVAGNDAVSLRDLGVITWC